MSTSLIGEDGREFYGGPLVTIWEDRTRPLSSPAMHRWWAGCLGVPNYALADARGEDRAITDFLRRTYNLKLAQMLAGRSDIAMTASVYAHSTRPTSRPP